MKLLPSPPSITVSQLVARILCLSSFECNDNPELTARWSKTVDRLVKSKPGKRQASATYAGLNGNCDTMPERIFR